MSEEAAQEGNSWNQWSRFVLRALEDNVEDHKAILAELKEIKEQQIRAREQLAELKVKAGIWGFAAGALPGLIALIMAWLK